MDAPGRLFASHPRLWRALLPRRTSTSHKYAHGHALVLGGGGMRPAPRAGAARAARAGAGLVTVVCPKDALAVYAAQLTAVMVAPFADDQEFAQILADPRRNGMLLGPGAGSGRSCAVGCSGARGEEGLRARCGCPDQLPGAAAGAVRCAGTEPLAC